MATAPPKIRRQWIKAQLVERGVWPEAREIMEQFKESQPAAYRDLQAVTKDLAVEVDVERLRLQVMKRVGDKIPEFGDRELVRLAVAFLPQKVEQKSEVKVESRTGDEIVELLKQYGPALERVAGTIASKDGPAQ